MQARTVGIWTLVHRVTSLFCTANLTLLAATGLILIFHDEIEGALGNAPRVSTSTGHPLSPEQLVQAACRLKPGWTPGCYLLDDDEPGQATVAMLPPGVSDFGKAQPVSVNIFTGESTVPPDFDQTFVGWVLEFHSTLFLGVGGQLLLAAVGLSFFVSLISGAVLYVPFMRNLVFGTVRRDRGRRVFQLDLHNFIGIATFAWCSLVAATGTILILSDPLEDYYEATEMAALLAPYRHLPPLAQPVPVSEAMATAGAAWPGFEMSVVYFPHTSYAGDHHYLVLMSGSSGLSRHLTKAALVDAATGKLAAAIEPPWYLRLMMIAGPLHFGDYGGLPLKIVWSLFTLLTLFLCLGGLYLFLARFRSRPPHGISS